MAFRVIPSDEIDRLNADPAFVPVRARSRG